MTTPAPSTNKNASWPGNLLLFVLLLVAPAWALYRTLGPSFVTYAAGWFTAISLVAAIATGLDKRKAQKQDWREPEAMLHLVELLGGWPGAFLAQRVFRHKTSKISYQIVFWLFVLLYQAVAIDCLLGWPGAKAVGAQVGL